MPTDGVIAIDTTFGIGLLCGPETRVRVEVGEFVFDDFKGCGFHGRVISASDRVSNTSDDPKPIEPNHAANIVIASVNNRVRSVISVQNLVVCPRLKNIKTNLTET